MTYSGPIYVVLENDFFMLEKISFVIGLTVKYKWTFVDPLVHLTLIVLLLDLTNFGGYLSNFSIKIANFI